MRNIIYLDIQAIPDRVFLPVIRRRNIVKAQISDTKQKEDVLIQQPMGDQTFIQRKDLVTQYRYLQDKKISLNGWKRNRKYNVYSVDNSQFFAMQVPINVVARVNGQVANRNKPKTGEYIVCYGGADGKVDKRTAKVMQAKLFHKMYSMPSHEVIRKHKGSNRKLVNPDKFSRWTNQKAPRPNPNTQAPRPNPNTQAPRPNPNTQAPQRPNPQRPVYSINTATLPGVGKNIARPLNTPQTNSIRTIGKLLSRSQLVGFVIRDGNNIRRVTSAQMKELIAKGIVTDIMVQRNGYGVEYFRGNGIQIEQLPSQQLSSPARE